MLVLIFKFIDVWNKLPNKLLGHSDLFDSVKCIESVVFNILEKLKILGGYSILNYMSTYFQKFFKLFIILYYICINMYIINQFWKIVIAKKSFQNKYVHVNCYGCTLYNEHTLQKKGFILQ